MSTSSYLITKLNGENWHEFEHEMRNLLGEKKKLRFISMKPSDLVTDEQKEDDVQAASMIKRRIESHLDYLVQDKTTILPGGATVTTPLTAAEVWSALKNHHEKTGVYGQMEHLQKVMTTTFQEGGDLNDHINKLRHHLRAIVAAEGEAISAPLQACVLLCSLRGCTTWDPTIQGITSTTSNDKLNFETVAKQLLREEHRRKNDDFHTGSADNSTALAAQTQRRGPSQTKAKGNHATTRRQPCTEPGCPQPTTHVTAKCWHKNGYPEGHPLHTSPKASKPSNGRHSNSSSSARKADIAKALPAEEDSDDPLDEEEAYTATVIEENFDVAATANQPEDDTTLTWKVDSGASKHYCHKREWFTDFKPTPTAIKLANGSRVNATGQGTVTCHTRLADGTTRKIKLRNVLYVPTFTFNLFSVRAFTKHGGTTNFEGASCTLLDRAGQPLCTAGAQGNLYSLVTHRGEDQSDEAANIAADVSPSLDLWHQRLGHANYRAVNQLFTKGMARDSNTPQIAATLGVVPKGHTRCEGCILGKHSRSPIPTTTDSRATRPLERVTMDVCGPFRTQAHGGYRFFVLFVDEYSHYKAIYPMRLKSEAFEHFKTYKTRAEKLHHAAGHVIQHVRSDNGGEFTSAAFNTFLDEHGIVRELTAAGTPQQNGMSERANRIVLNILRTIRVTAQLPKTFWAEAARAAVYLNNRTPTNTLGGMTPYEAWTGKKPRVGHLRKYGCLAFAYNNDGDKLNARSIPCTLIGYSADAATYRLWDNTGHRVITSRSVVWDEDTIGYTYVVGAGGQDSQRLTTPTIAVHPDDIDDDIQMDPTSGVNLPAQPPVLPAQPPVAHDPAAIPAQAHPAALPGPAGPVANIPSSDTETRQQRRERRLQRELGNHLQPGPHDGAPSPFFARPEASSNLALLAGEANSGNDPSTLQEAFASPEAAQWRAAWQAEYDSLQKASTYELVPRPKNKNVIGCKTVLKVKRGKDGQLLKFKARFVAKGYAQRYGIDYEETYAPVARYPSIRMLVALAAHYDWDLHHMDVKSAYLNGDLDEEIYMEQPEGSAVPGKEDYVCRLRKSLYGLKQAGRTWHHKINRALQQRGFIPLESDHCVYVRKQNSSIIIIALYVDDLLLAASDPKELRSFKQNLTREFEMEDLGEATFILGIEILRDRKRRAITITQTAYINTLLERHGHADAYCTATPMESDAHHVKAATTYQANASTIREYQTMIGGIMFAMLCTRPDIAFAVATLSKFAQNPSPAHMAGVRRVLRYLRATDKLGIRYASTDPPTQQPQLIGYTDSDWAADRDDRKSISGYAFLLCGGAISWQAKKQQTAALSTVEAEYLAAAAAAKEALWWRNQLAGLGHDMSQPTTLLCDNLGTIALTKNPVHHASTKHIDLRYHFIRDHVEKRVLRLQHIRTTDMAADILTKPLSGEKHIITANLLGMPLTTSSSSRGGVKERPI